MEQNTEYVYTLKQTSQFKKDLKAVKFDEHKLDELQKVLEHLGHTGMVSCVSERTPSSSISKGNGSNLFHLPSSNLFHHPSAIRHPTSLIHHPSSIKHQPSYVRYCQSEL